MNPIFKKLGLTNQNPVLILNAPEGYTGLLQELPATIHSAPAGKYRFIQIFAHNLAEANQLVKESIQALEGDGHFWLCYPKGTSKKYKSDINREKTWEVMAPYEFEPVSQVAVDDDWSAMRFKKVEHIKEMKRKTASTEKGKERIKGK
ncbi:MAG TPA: DUF3052 domain-containing protein [Bacillota bacterium]|nr:DUF3052 domain-containing protein [Bacillota bacterium]